MPKGSEVPDMPGCGLPLLGLLASGPLDPPAHLQAGASHPGGSETPRPSTGKGACRRPPSTRGCRILGPAPCPPSVATQAVPDIRQGAQRFGPHQGIPRSRRLHQGRNRGHSQSFQAGHSRQPHPPILVVETRPQRREQLGLQPSPLGPWPTAGGRGPGRCGSQQEYQGHQDPKTATSRSGRNRPPGTLQQRKQ